ncbi:MAG: UbiA family prenyltransferase [Methanolinea sp.]|jgi:4-hydroxybenzoate polyprenyltransferase|nr:UbiA family prenyltransferase [Methanolinea sp.]
MVHLRAYADILRLHFFFAWPLLFCSGYLLATTAYGSFSMVDLCRVSLIGLLGFEGGLVLNDYIDREYDKRDTEFGRLTKYWRIFGTRPIPAGLIAPRSAFLLFLILAASALILTATLPFPHSLFVALILVYCYAAEAFYQVKKRNQSFPVAQLVGRTDFALFPVAGYLCSGFPDQSALLYFLFFYPFAMAHLGVNDLVDIANDRARGMQTIPILYDMQGTVRWIAGFFVLHVILAFIFLTRLGAIAVGGVLLGLVVLLVAVVSLIRNPTPEGGMKVLPLFHIAMLLYAGSLVLGSLV